MKRTFIILISLILFTACSPEPTATPTPTPLPTPTALPTATPLPTTTPTTDFSNPWIVTICGGIIVAVIGGVIVLYIEYNHFKRKERDKETTQSAPSQPSGTRTWDSAAEIAVRNFKGKIKKYVWVYEKTNVVKLSVSKGQATLDVIVTTTRNAGVGKSIPIERYHLKIDRTGEIYEMISVPLEGYQDIPDSSNPARTSHGKDSSTVEQKSRPEKEASGQFVFSLYQELVDYAWSGSGLDMTKEDAANWAEAHMDYFSTHSLAKFRKLVDYAWSGSGLDMTKSEAAKWAFQKMEK